jgi:hypothetical protein
MDDETVKTKFGEQLEAARASAMSRVFRWEFELDGLILYVTLRPRRRPELAYLLRVIFDEFPRRAPSYVFVNKATRELDDGSWPAGVRHSSSPPGICTPGTRECHEHYHAGDGGHPWDATKRTLLSTLQEIHRMMERGIGG